MTSEEQVDGTLRLWAAESSEDEITELADKAKWEALHLENRRQHPDVPWYREDYVHSWYGGRFFGVIRMRRRLFNVGDIVIGHFCNGQGERWKIWGRSSRGYDVKGCYVDFQRWKQGRKHALPHDQRYDTDNLSTPDICSSDHTQGRLLVCPDELKCKPSTDPVIRAWLVEQARLARRTPVTADSGGPSLEGRS